MHTLGSQPHSHHFHTLAMLSLIGQTLVLTAPTALDLEAPTAGGETYPSHLGLRGLERHYSRVIRAGHLVRTGVRLSAEVLRMLRLECL